MTNIEQLVNRLRTSPEYRDRIAHYRFLEPRPPQWRDPAEVLSPALAAGLKSMGIERLYAHQAEAITRLREGQSVGITTPTASGKTLIYNVAVAERLLQEPDAHALYLFPLKALAQDQWKTLQAFFAALGRSDLQAAIYDGDTPASQRAKIKRRPPQVLLTNPDMLHYGLLAYPEGWREFFRRLRYVVIDEAHTYRGVFGSHVSLVLRRSLRLCGRPGPTLVASSATMANAEEFLRALTGRVFTVIEASGAPRQGRHVVLVNPQGSPYSEAAGLLGECLEHDIKTILFTKSRKITELIHIWVRDAAPRFERRIAAYRSGYLPEERRQIEQRLFRDELLAVISTSALEAGIDVGGLDAAILVGYPGTMISTWQRVGRAGRARDALMILVALPDALDQYFLRHPDAFFRARFENCVLDPANLHILRGHLPCAAQEEPLTRADADWFGAEALEAIPGLVQEGRLQEAATGDRWYSAFKVPHRKVDIRSVGEQYLIKQERTGTLLGSIDEPRVFKECHPGAVYLQGGQQYEVTGLDLSAHTVLVREADGEWYTQYTSSEEIEILDLPPGESVQASDRRFRAGLVRVRVTETIVSYERRRVRDQGLLSEHKLNLPPRVFETQAVLLTVPDFLRRRAVEFGLDFGGGLHAVEHAGIAALPVHVLCDRWDLGGVSTLAHPQADQPCIFIYDGYPGGVGLGAKGLEVLESWMATARDMVEQCGCEDGCPACIHSPKCGSRNQPLDKQACRMIFNALLREPVEPLTFSVENVRGARPTVIPAASLPAVDVPPTAPDEAPPRPAALGGRDFRLVVFDLETKRRASDVGGWNHVDRMGLSLGVVYDDSTRAFTTYREEEVSALMQHLLSADVVVGFNIDRFDLAVLAPYSPHVGRVRTFDIAQEVHCALGHRVSLDHLARLTLGRGKTAEGLQAVQWFEEGNWADLETYCRADVEITRDLLWFGLRYHYLLFERRGVTMKIPLSWRSRFPTTMLDSR